MEQIESHLRDYLLSFVSITTVVGQRIYPNHGPQKDAVYPYVVYHRISSNRWRTTSGTASTAQVRIQLDCYADKYAQASAARAAIAAVIDAFSAPASSSSGGACLQSLAVEDSRDSYEEPVHGDEIGEHVCSLDVMVTYK